MKAKKKTPGWIKRRETAYVGSKCCYNSEQQKYTEIFEILTNIWCLSV